MPTSRTGMRSSCHGTCAGDADGRAIKDFGAAWHALPSSGAEADTS